MLLRLRKQVISSQFWLFFFLSVWGCILNAILLYWFIIYYRIDSYAQFKAHVLSVFSGSYLVEDIEKYFLSASTFESTKHFLLISFLLLVFLLLILWLMKKVAQFLPKTTEEDINSFEPRDQVYLFVFFLGWLAYKIFLINYLPIHIDEVFDYQFFAKTNLITRHTYQFFEGSHWINTQVFYADLCSVFYNMGLPSTYAMRLPSLLGEFYLLIFIVRNIKFPSLRQLIITLFVIVISFWTSVYSIQARSYYLIGVCAFCSFVYLYRMYTKPTSTHFFTLLIYNIIGFALCKLYFVPFLGLILYFTFTRPERKDYRWFLPLCILVSIFTILFYAPVVLLGGLKCIYAPTSGDHFSGLSLYPAFFEIPSFITNIDQKAYLVFCLFPLLFLGKNRLEEKTQHVYLYLSAQFSAILICCLLIGAYLPARLFTYCNIAFSLFIVLLTFQISARFKHAKILQYSLCIILTFNTLYNFGYGWANNDSSYVLGRDYYGEIEKFLSKIQQLKPKNIFIPKEEHAVGFYALNRFEDKLHVNMSDSMSHEEVCISSSDTALDGYQKIHTSPKLGLTIYSKK